MESTNKKVLKSGPSVEKADVYFFNITSRTVDVYWVDYEGVPKHYKNLLPRCYFMSSSYTSHPWIAVDTKTHSRLRLGMHYVYYPGSSDPKRNYAVLTIPTFSLRTFSLQAIGDHLMNTDCVEQLELPVSLKHEITQMMGNRTMNFIELYKKDCTIGLPQEECDKYNVDK